MTRSRTTATVTSLAALACASGLLAAPAQASGGGTDVRASGTCAGGGTWKLKAKHDDGRIEIEFEVDTNHAGQRWHVRIKDNAKLVTDRYATTVAPSGSFTVHAATANQAGTDAVHATATRGTRACSGTVRL
jgi:hypothetical protein